MTKPRDKLPRRDKATLRHELDSACSERDRLEELCTVQAQRILYLEVERWHEYTLVPVKPSPQFLAFVGMSAETYERFLQAAATALNGKRS